MTSMVVFHGFFLVVILLYLLVAFDTTDHFLSLAFIPYTLGIPSTSVAILISVIFVDLILLYPTFSVGVPQGL